MPAEMRALFFWGGFKKFYIKVFYYYFNKWLQYECIGKIMF